MLVLQTMLVVLVPRTDLGNVGPQKPHASVTYLAVV